VKVRGHLGDLGVDGTTIMMDLERKNIGGLRLDLSALG
jgi:hypothetical protein